jgi:hypothetical protein
LKPTPLDRDYLSFAAPIPKLAYTLLSDFSFPVNLDSDFLNGLDREAELYWARLSFLLTEPVFYEHDV